jgi:hypothetical protein
MSWKKVNGLFWVAFVLAPKRQRRRSSAYRWNTYLLLRLADEALFEPVLALFVAVFSGINGNATCARAGGFCSRLAMLVRVEM